MWMIMEILLMIKISIITMMAAAAVVVEIV